MRRSTALVLVFIVVVLIGTPVLLGTLTWVRITESFRGYSEPERFVEIPPGASTAEIGRRLVDDGIVSDTLTFRAALWWTGASRRLKAGEYRFESAMPAVEVVERVARGEVYQRRITFPEGLTIREMADIFEKNGFGSASAFIQSARDASAITDLDPEATDLEGYLFPDTYALPRNTMAARLVRLMVDRFRMAFTDELRRAAAASGLTVRQIVTLASLIEKETAKGEERPRVAAVYMNRLKRGMPLQADPTVIYALQKAGRYDGNIRRDDLGIESPYNTYQRTGLPPGPIAAPGRASLEAAVNPAAVDHLYFVSRNDGGHVFADTLAEHNANVRKFQIEYFRNERLRGRR